MSEAMWVWDYELKTLGSWPSTGYNGHNTPVEVVTQMDVKTLRDERDRLRRLIEPLLKMTPERPNAITWENGVQIINYVQDILKAALTPEGGGQDGRNV